MIQPLLKLFIVVACIQLRFVVQGFAFKSNIILRKSRVSLLAPALLRDQKPTYIKYQRTISLLNCNVESIQCSRKKKEESDKSEKEGMGAVDNCVHNFENNQCKIGSNVRVGVLLASYNSEVTKNLYKGASESLLESGVVGSNIFTTSIPSPYELPVTAKLLAASKRVDVIIALGCLTQDDTITPCQPTAAAVASGLMQVSLDTLIPCIYGVLTAPSFLEAVALSNSTVNPGHTWGKAAVEMGLTRMAAMGQNGKSVSTEGKAPLVTFPGLSPTVPKVKEAKEAKKFGF